MNPAVHNAIASSAATERRTHDREAVISRTVVRSPTAPTPIEVETRDFSSSGCQFVSPQQFVIGTRITLGLDGAGSATATIVRSDGINYACVFDRPLSAADLKTAFRGTIVIQISSAAFELPDDGRWPRHKRMRLVLILGILAWAVPTGLFLLA